MKTFFVPALTAAVLFIAFTAAAQQTPASAVNWDDIEAIQLPAQDNKALLLEELSLREPGRAPRFAVNMPVDVEPALGGNWEALSDGRSVWRLRVNSPGAKSINLGFSEFRMPSGASLLLWTADGRRLGPFTPADNEEHGELWTPVLKGDELMIEVVVPTALKSDLELRLSSINHDFLGFGSAAVSGSCNLDVICEALDGWPQVDTNRDIIRSVAVIGLGGGTFCTGFLINNGRSDCTPLFMTADHCGITSSNAASLVTYWKFENSICRMPGSPASGGAGDGSLGIFNTGSIFRAGYGPSDMTIVELDDEIDPDGEPFMAGWSAEDIAPQHYVAVHHPNTDEKRISFDDDPGAIDGFGGGTDTHLRVFDWDVGTTEPGSSGSPVFDEHKRVVGQLHGGGAACGNDLSDWYGRIAVSWDGGGTPSTRLSDWLDPDGLGNLTLDGKDCSFTLEVDPPVLTYCAQGTTSSTFNITPSGNFSGPVTLSITAVPTGVSGSFGTNPVSPSVTTTMDLAGLDGLASGVYSVEVTGDDGASTGSAVISLVVFDGSPAAAMLESPMMDELDVSTAPFLNWEDVPFAQTYEVDVASDEGFTDIVASFIGLTESEVQVLDLDELTEYWWRVRGSNECGNSAWSETRHFTTANILCNVPPSVDVPQLIDDGPPNIVTSLLPIIQDGEIEDVNVIGLTGTHTWVEDLEFILISPSGTEVRLISFVCGDDDNFNISFDDEVTGTPPCPYDDGNTYPPVEALSAFDGEIATGTWIMRIQDNAGQDGGSLDEWSLQICTKVDSTVMPPNGLHEFDASRLALFPNPAYQNVQLDLGAPASGELQVELISLEGRLMKAWMIPSGTRIMDLEVAEFTSGMYQIRVAGAHAQTTRKLVLLD